MAQLVSMSKINGLDNSGAENLEQNSVRSPSEGNPYNGVCAITIDGQLSNNSISQNNHLNHMKKSSSKASLSTKRVVNVQWKNITLTTKKGTMILKQVAGEVKSGEMTAIMGPSGAGKTSLLNVLSGFTRHKVSGQVLVNGVNREMRSYKKLFCYIMQDDHLLPYLTVKESATIAANLKIPSTVSKKERKKAVDECLRALGLEPVKNQRASELSGGQRKRLCVALELVSNPPLIFLDEPTSGLDSSSCLQCIQLLKSLAEEGRTVVCTIHQPSSKIFEIFDNLYMVADGQCIYRGSTRNLVPFLAEQGLNCPQYYNPTDYITEVAMGDHGDWNSRLVKATNDANENNESSSIYGADSKQELNLQASTISLLDNRSDKSSVKSESSQEKNFGGYTTSFWNQFQILLGRSFTCMLRDPINCYLKLAGNISISLLLGALYYGVGNDASKVFNNAGFLFVLMLFLFYTAQLPTLLTFPSLKTVFEREHMNSWYSVEAYYLAVTTSEIPFQVLFPVIDCGIVYWMTDQPNDLFRFALLTLSMVLLSLGAQATGQIIGSVANPQNGVFITSSASLPILLFSGFFITMKTIPAYFKWISYVNFARYSFQSILVGIYSMDRPPLFCNKTSCPFEDPEVILTEFEVEGSLYVDYSALAAFIILFKIVAYLILKFKATRIH